jgi:trehalose-phosphatase
VVIAFVTGRDASDVRGRTGGIRAYVAGSHGVECEAPDGRLVWSPRRSAFVAPDSDLIAELEGSGARVEVKRNGVALHFRGATINDGHQALDRFERWAKANALELVAGRCVMEARVGGGDKRLALVKLAKITRASRVVFAGDDLTDFPALRWAGQRGRAIFVMSGERNPPHAARIECIDSIERLAEILYDELYVWTSRMGSGVPSKESGPQPGA